MRAALLSAFLVAAGATARLPAQPCAPSWSDAFPLVELDDVVYTLAVADLGDGPALFAGGEFQTDSFHTLRGLGRWEGDTWAPVRDSDDTWQTCPTITVHNDGLGEALYAPNYFGPFENGYYAIGRYDGQSWTPLANTQEGFAGGSAVALLWFDDGSGPALYAAGGFSAIDGVPAKGIARWDGHEWSEVGGGFEPTAPRVLFAWDDGSGPALYAGGWFKEAGGQPAKGIARWDGQSWSEVGGGLTGFEGTCFALASFDDGTGPALWVGGAFSRAGDLQASCIARWDGQSWRSAGEFHGTTWNGALVHCLKVVDLGDGPRLYAGGSFDNDKYDAEKRVKSLAVWDPDTQSWGNAAPGKPNRFNGFVYDIAVLPEGGRPVMYAAGSGYQWYGVPADNIVRFDGQQWSRVGTGVEGDVVDSVSFDAGDGPRMYVAGTFQAAGDIAARGIASWDSARAWSDVGGSATVGMDDPYEPTVSSLAVSAATGQPLLYAAGGFARMGDFDTPHSFAAWDGQRWFMPPGMAPAGKIFKVIGLDSPTLGPALYAEGYVETEDSLAWARWMTDHWETIPGASAKISALALYDDGSGPSLYAAGDGFIIEGREDIESVARWDGQEWHDVGSPLNAGNMRALQVYDSGNGPLLYASGQMSKVQFHSAFEQIAAWNGQQWHDVAGGLSTFDPYQFLGTLDLAVADDGSGPSLFACGRFELASGKPALQAAKWNGLEWSALGKGLGPRIPYSPRTVAFLDDPEEPSVFFGGKFLTAGGLSSGRIARWVGRPPCKADCYPDGVLDLLDFLCFNAAFGAGSGKADCDGSGTLDLFDYFCFSNAFNAGC